MRVNKQRICAINRRISSQRRSGRVQNER